MRALVGNDFTMYVNESGQCSSTGRLLGSMNLDLSHRLGFSFSLDSVHVAACCSFSPAEGRPSKVSQASLISGNVACVGRNPPWKLEAGISEEGDG